MCIKIIDEKSLTEFNFWSGAADFAEKLTYGELKAIDDIISDLYPDGIDATSLNDIFWFDQESVCEWIGLDLDEVYER